MLRVQEIINPDGEEVRVPFISGNSVKHMIRQAGVEFALSAMNIPDGTFSKQVVDLLFSGGHLSKGGAAVNLQRARQIADLFPILSVCGYSAGNYMAHSKLKVDQIHLVCEENLFRLPINLKEYKQAKTRASVFRGEDFGTRHEATRSPRVAKLLSTEAKALLEGRISEALEKSEKGEIVGKAADSSQMIFEFQVIKPGSMLFGGLNYIDLSVLELAALSSALNCACQGEVADGLVFHLGAKSSIGLGRVAMKWSGSIRGPVAPISREDNSLVPEKGSTVPKAYIEHLRRNRDDIIKLLEETMA